MRRIVFIIMLSMALILSACSDQSETENDKQYLFYGEGQHWIVTMKCNGANSGEKASMTAAYMSNIEDLNGKDISFSYGTAMGTIGSMPEHSTGNKGTFFVEFQDNFLYPILGKPEEKVLVIISTYNKNDKSYHSESIELKQYMEIKD